MVYLEKTFYTEAEADTFIESYCRNYHPAGYGTSCRKVISKDEPGKILVKISRGDSCD
jgi:hypothetical protein